MRNTKRVKHKQTRTKQIINSREPGARSLTARDMHKNHPRVGTAFRVGGATREICSQASLLGGGKKEPPPPHRAPRKHREHANPGTTSRPSPGVPSLLTAALFSSLCERKNTRTKHEDDRDPASSSRFGLAMRERLQQVAVQKPASQAIWGNRARVMYLLDKERPCCERISADRSPGRPQCVGKLP